VTGTKAIDIPAGEPNYAVEDAVDLPADVSVLSVYPHAHIIEPTEIDVLQVMRKNLTWIGVVASVRRHFAEGIRLIQSGKVRPEELITPRLPLSGALDGFQALRCREAVKVMFRVTG
jgi:threonine dehydrogenase-like Zn-dependent dehydrogenase